MKLASNLQRISILRFEDPSEWISGASPTSVSILDNDPRSELRILSIQPTTSGAVLSFSSSPDRSYVIERSHQIGAPQWVTALSVGRGNGEVMCVEVPAPVGSAASFFRVREL